MIPRIRFIHKRNKERGGAGCGWDADDWGVFMKKSASGKPCASVFTGEE